MAANRSDDGAPRAVKLTRIAVAQAALDIIDEDGLDALSIGAIASRLGVRGPSLYHYFGSKADILAEVVRLVISATAVPPRSPNTDWREWLVAYSVNTRRAILRHPNAAGLLFEFFPRELVATVYERTSRVLQEQGVPVAQHVLIFEGLDTITLGSTLHAARRPAEERFGEIDAAQHPSLTAARAANAWRNDEELFVETMRSFLRGVADGQG